MKKFKPQHSRLLFIDKKIRESTYPNCSSLGDEWEVSSKTIQRDIEYLRNMLDAPLAYDAKKKGYYYTENSFQLPAIALNDSDLFAIFIAGKVLIQYENTPIYSRLKSVFEKIEESLPDKVTIDPGVLDDRFSFFSSPHTTISEEVWEVLFSALRTSHSVIIFHAKPEEQVPETRTIDPYHVVNFQGEWYVLGFCHTRKNLRTFAMSRITKALVTTSSFTIPENFDFMETTRNRFGVQWSDRQFQVSIWFSSKAAPYILERTWHEGQQITRKNDGSITMTFPTTHLTEVKRWILSWGEMARVLEPVELIDDIRNDLSNMGDYYRQ